MSARNNKDVGIPVSLKISRAVAAVMKSIGNRMKEMRRGHNKLPFRIANSDEPPYHSNDQQYNCYFHMMPIFSCSLTNPLFSYIIGGMNRESN